MISQKKGAFTLVELIVIISILIILSSVWFLSYVNHLKWARDTNRITQLASISDWLSIYRTKWYLPFPDNKVDIVSWATIIWYQWYVWENVLNSIDFSKWWKDAKDKVYFSYYISKNKKYFQLLSHLEEKSKLSSVNFWVNTSYAEGVDYSKRFIALAGDNIWILTDTTNTPVHEIADIIIAWKLDLAGTNSWTIYLSHVKEDEVFQDTWYNIQYNLLTNTDTIYKAPSSCAPWFIPVPWSATFSQKWFCVAKYEMTLEAWTWTLTSTWNAYDYTWSGMVSSNHDYPIWDITQQEAIDACKNYGKWYHLVTDNEWMTIARNIEAEWKNWSSWTVWGWYIWNWNTKDTVPTMWCDDSTWSKANWTKTWSWADTINLSWTRTTCDEKRQLILSNNEIIWDFSGNMREHVNKANTLDWSLYGSWQTSISWCSPSTGIAEWNTCPWVESSYGITYTSANWIWVVNDSAWVSSNIFIRWWTYWDINNSWIYSLDLWEIDTFKQANLWFRCVK